MVVVVEEEEERKKCKFVISKVKRAWIDDGSI